MSRNLHASTAGALAGKDVRLAWLANVEFESGTLYLWTGVGHRKWSAWSPNTYQGVGHLGGVSQVPEAGDLRAAGIQLTLSGIDPAMVGTVLGDSRQGKSVRLWLATFDATWELVGDPHEAFGGLFDVPVLEDDGQTARITISVENVLIRLDQPNERRYTDEDQQHEFPGDRGMEFVAEDLSNHTFGGGGLKPGNRTKHRTWE